MRFVDPSITDIPAASDNRKISLRNSKDEQIYAYHDTRTNSCEKNDQPGLISAAVVPLADNKMVDCGWQHGANDCGC